MTKLLLPRFFSPAVPHPATEILLNITFPLPFFFYFSIRYCSASTVGLPRKRWIHGFLFKGVATPNRLQASSQVLRTSWETRQCHHCLLASSKGVPEVFICLLVAGEHLYLLELEDSGRLEALYQRANKYYKVEENGHADTPHFSFVFIHVVSSLLCMHNEQDTRATRQTMKHLSKLENYWTYDSSHTL